MFFPSYPALLPTLLVSILMQKVESGGRQKNGPSKTSSGQNIFIYWRALFTAAADSDGPRAEETRI
jgi:hypothetical protein